MLLESNTAFCVKNDASPSLAFLSSTERNVESRTSCVEKNSAGNL